MDRYNNIGRRCDVRLWGDVWSAGRDWTVVMEGALGMYMLRDSRGDTIWRFPQDMTNLY